MEETLDSSTISFNKPKHILDLVIDSLKEGYRTTKTNSYVQNSPESLAFTAGRLLRDNTKDYDFKAYIIHDEDKLYAICPDEQSATDLNDKLQKRVTLASHNDKVFDPLTPFSVVSITDLSTWGIINEIGLWENLYMYFKRIGQQFN